MRAIYINSYEQKIEEIDLPIQVSEFQKTLRYYLKTNDIKILHSNELLTVIYDEYGVYNNEHPAFFSNLVLEWPIFGNVICVGRNPINREMDDLFELYKAANFGVRWCDLETTNKFRKIVREFADNNLT